MAVNSGKEDRKLEIVLAARLLLAREGEAGFSLREVAKKVGIKLASLQYHFPTKASLVEAILNYTVDTYIAELQSLPSFIDGNPIEALASALEWLTGADKIDVEETRLEIHLWSMALNDQSVAESLRRYHAIYIAKTTELIASAVPEINVLEARKRAIAIASMQEGSMLFMDGEFDALTRKQILEQIYQSSLKIAFG